MKKLLLFCVTAIAAVSAWAEGSWMLITDSGESVPMHQVGMLVAADDATTFSVVKVDGAGEAITGVSSVSFAYDAAWSGIDVVDHEGENIVIDGVSSSILVMGCAGREYDVYDASGVIRLSGVVDGVSARIDVSSLNSGVYVLRVGNSSVKFKK
ncbi:MAG: T9SS type A sorting domain-containing protein [Muribaculaceae bacterium]|nr:T9SS type A sorting domain-containing protein [Muribaculaceae bacterium]